MSYFLLSTVNPWLITLLLLIIVIISVLMLPRLFREVKKIPGRYLLILLLSLLIGFVLRFYFVPNFHRIYYDEDRYLSYAVTFARFNKVLNVEFASPEKFIMGVPDDAARTSVPVINGWVLKAFGYSEHNLFQAAKIFSVLQIALIFILAFVLFKNYLAASLSGAAMALLPTNIYWSPSIALDAFAVTFALLSLIGAIWYARAPNLKSALLLVSSIYILLGVRIESGIFLPVIIFAIYAVRKDGRKPIITKKELPYIILFLSLIAFRALLSISVIGQKWCCAEALPLEVFAPNYFIRNLLPNVLNFFTKVEFPFIISILAFISLVGEKGKLRLVLGLWIAAYFVLYSTYYAGNFFTVEFSGSYGRYFLMMIPPAVMLASVALIKTVEKFKAKRLSLFFIIFLLLLPFIPTALKYKTLISTSPYFMYVEAGPKALHEFMENGIIKNTPNDSVIIHSLTGYILLEGRTSIFIGHFFTRDDVRNLVERYIKENKPVYILETHECELYPDRCEGIVDKFKFTPMNLKEGKGIGLDLSKVELLDATRSAK